MNPDVLKVEAERRGDLRPDQEILRWAEAKGWNVTAEVCPHYLPLLAWW